MAGDPRHPGGPSIPGFDYDTFYNDWDQSRLADKTRQGQEQVALEQPGRDAKWDMLKKILAGLQGQMPGLFNAGGSSGSSTGTGGGFTLPPRV